MSRPEGEGKRRGEAAGASEEALIRARRDKADRIRARGENPFANDVTEASGADGKLASLAEARALAASARLEDGRYDASRVPEARVRVAGRVLFVRAFGGVTFVRLRDRTGELQLLCDEAALGEGYGRLEDVDLGDFVEAKGPLTATQKGELSVKAESLRVLTKALRPLPTKTHFKDVEARYRQRYVDLVANPQVASVFRARSVLVRTLRAFFDGRGFLEVETPSMHTLIGGAAAKPFSTHHNALDMQLFMRIAPELYLKRLVVGGFERVYEIARCYRNEGLSTRHNPEFTMLEYYEAYATYVEIMDQTEEMLRFLDERLAEAMPAESEAWRRERPFSFERFVRAPMRKAVAAALERAGLPANVPQEISGESPPIKEWAKAAKAKGREIDWTNFRAGAKKCESAGEGLFCAYEYLAEPFLAADYRTEDGKKSVPVFVTDHPFEVSPLARKKESDPGLVDRFELFVEGRELCNAFSELNDPDDQAERFRAQVERKARGAEETMDYDADYIRALEHGMPPTAGFGMGVDRLAMLMTNSPSIRDVILFPLLRPEGGG